MNPGWEHKPDVSKRTPSHFETASNHQMVTISGHAVARGIEQTDGRFYGSSSFCSQLRLSKFVARTTAIDFLRCRCSPKKTAAVSKCVDFHMQLESMGQF